MKNERLIALKILVTFFQQKDHLSHLLNQEKCTPLVKELCYGVTRFYFRLEAIALSLMKKSPKDKEIEIILLMGLYQLYFLRMPDYAVVKETVNLLSYINKTWAKGLVNAVLRRFCREQDEILTNLEKNNNFHHNHPAWFVKQIKKDWPDHWQQIVKNNDAHPPMTLRINTRATNRENYLRVLQENNIAANPTTYSAEGIILEKPCGVEDLPHFSQGVVSVQDEAAQMAPSLLQLKPHLSLLDACCAPGGKTCHILEIEQVDCTALDVEPKRLLKVQENLQRLHLQATVILGDALKPNDWWSGMQFDRILLDAPCSATGVIRRHPDIKILRTPDEIKNVIQVQSQLLKSVWPLLKPGGILLYATCSLLKDENENQVAKFLQEHKNGESLTIKATWGHSTGHGRQILPGENNMDGFFYSVLKKKEAWE
ncbi:Sun protein (plasmid) [Legionella adelaidensis]|uniref:16S rRNA (cytosine(967)-C(5))-methyltransferase n=1 Tax=Legionella adelaidensis TaxID=45056 RepID=A0A0W0R5P7_9GAMM|nr:16S rRNA (cytosine(967)-C(5))-methyltransferase RsmB [Legionella adelaidensis]KTC66415.1 rRNA methyltransferase [Legionella adelaidensis]VEH85013.1 Sun protein [Legionella adelaidensis]